MVGLGDHPEDVFVIIPHSSVCVCVVSLRGRYRLAGVGTHHGFVIEGEAL